jgi:hypothetical protein
MALKNKNTVSNENAKLSDNIRQMQSTPQNQILVALDTLGAKLVRSETERETMKRLLSEALDAQDRLENQLERSHIDIQRRIDKMDEGLGLSEEVQTILDEQNKLISDSKLAITDHETRQIRVEDKVNDSKQVIAKLQRRIDSQEQKRAKLQRRIERVENIASEAQNALAAKSLVLLTDQSRQIEALPHIDASGPMQALNDLHDDQIEGRKTLPLNSVMIGCLLFLALIAGWLIATTLRPSDKAFVVLQDGTLAQIDVQNGTAQPIEFKSTPMQLNTNVESVNTPPLNSGIEEDLALLSTDWITRDIIDQVMRDEASAEFVMDSPSVQETNDNISPTTEPVANDMTIDRDLSLPSDILNLEEKAFNGLAEAQHDLAALYTAGQAGVQQNYERAYYWFKQAADQGIANAAYNLGVLNHQGLGQAQNMDRALDWYRRAAQLGHPEAQYNLGIAYIEGIGTRYNPNMAAAFFQQAALGGIVEAAYNLGLILENGLLGEVRPEAAMRWYRGAAENGSVEAGQALSALSARLDLPEAQAGFLENGTSLAPYITDDVLSVGNNQAVPAEIENDISLGSLVPTRAQIMVAQIQEQLRKMKYYNGPQDGIVGVGTVQSIKSYQIKEGLPADGQASEELLSYMLANGTDY